MGLLPAEEVTDERGRQTPVSHHPVFNNVTGIDQHGSPRCISGVADTADDLIGGCQNDTRFRFKTCDPTTHRGRFFARERQRIVEIKGGSDCLLGDTRRFRQPMPQSLPRLVTHRDDGRKPGVLGHFGNDTDRAYHDRGAFMRGVRIG